MFMVLLLRSLLFLLVSLSSVLNAAPVGEGLPARIVEARNLLNDRLISRRFFVDDEIRNCLRLIKDHGSMEDALLWTRAAYFYRLDGYQAFNRRAMGGNWDPLENLAFLHETFALGCPRWLSAEDELTFILKTYQSEDQAFFKVLLVGLFNVLASRDREAMVQKLTDINQGYATALKEMDIVNALFEGRAGLICGPEDYGALQTGILERVAKREYTQLPWLKIEIEKRGLGLASTSSSKPPSESPIINLKTEHVEVETWPRWAGLGAVLLLALGLILWRLRSQKVGGKSE